MTAIEIVGGQVALASAIRKFAPNSRVMQGHVWKWINGLKGKTPPPEYVLAISAATGWQITPHTLRPDIYPNPTDGLPACHQDKEAA